MSTTEQSVSAKAAADTDAALARLVAIVERLGDGDLHRAHRDGGFTVSEVISHINVSVLLWCGDIARLTADADLRFFFREEVGHDAKGYPPPTVELALGQLASTRRTVATFVPKVLPEVLARTVEIPDLGTLTVEEWTPLIMGHAIGHVDQAVEILVDRDAMPAGGLLMRAAVITELHKVHVEDRPEPTARPGWVVVDVEAISVCGTDVHQLEGRIETPFPRVPGHDFSGRVSEVGEGVDPDLVGTPVAVKPSLPCDECPTCLGGQYDECPRKKLMGLWSDGCYTERVEVPHTSLVPRPEDVPAWQACLLEPLAVALNTLDRVQIQLGDTVLVLGQGPIGLSMTRLAALSGAGKLIVTDVREEVFAIAREWGATHTVNVAERDAVEAIMELTDGKGADVVIETSGVVASGEIVIDVTRKEGKLAMIGFAKDLTPLPIIPMLMKTLTLFAVGGNGGRGQYERALQLLHTGRVQLDRLVTHRYSLEDVAKALDANHNRQEGSIKVVLTP